MKELKELKEQRVFILKKEEVETGINPWLHGELPYNVKSVKELSCGLLFIVLTK